MVEKSPDAFRTISEVASDLDVPQHVLRFWETRFSQVKPMKRGGGRRYYRPDDVELLRGIRHLLYGDGYTIKGVQRILRENGVRHVIGLGKALHDDVSNGAMAPVEDTEPAAPVAPAAVPPAGAGTDTADDRPDGAERAAEPTPPEAEPDEPAPTRVAQAAESQLDGSEIASPNGAPPEAEETIDFSASRSVLVRRRQEEDAAALRPQSADAPMAPEPTNGAGGADAVQASTEATPSETAEPAADPSPPTGRPPPTLQPSTVHPSAVQKPMVQEPTVQAPDAADPAAKAAAAEAGAVAGLDDDDVIRLQAAVFELLECRRILSGQD